MALLFFLGVSKQGAAALASTRAAIRDRASNSPEASRSAPRRPSKRVKSAATVEDSGDESPSDTPVAKRRKVAAKGGKGKEKQRAPTRRGQQSERSPTPATRPVRASELRSDGEEGSMDEPSGEEGSEYGGSNNEPVAASSFPSMGVVYPNPSTSGPSRLVPRQAPQQIPQLTTVRRLKGRTVPIRGTSFCFSFLICPDCCFPAARSQNELAVQHGDTGTLLLHPSLSNFFNIPVSRVRLDPFIYLFIFKSFILYLIWLCRTFLGLSGVLTVFLVQLRTASLPLIWLVPVASAVPRKRRIALFQRPQLFVTLRPRSSTVLAFLPCLVRTFPLLFLFLIFIRI